MNDSDIYFSSSLPRGLKGSFPRLTDRQSRDQYSSRGRNNQLSRSNQRDDDICKNSYTHHQRIAYRKERYAIADCTFRNTHRGNLEGGHAGNLSVKQASKLVGVDISQSARRKPEQLTCVAGHFHLVLRSTTGYLHPFSTELQNATTNQRVCTGVTFPHLFLCSFEFYARKNTTSAQKRYDGSHVSQ